MTEYRLSVQGDLGVGKSALVIQLISNHFIDNYDPTIEESYRERVVIDEESCLLDILDTSISSFIGKADGIQLWAEGFVFVYSITSRSSFEEMEGYMCEVLRAREELFPIIVCGNKSDLEEYRQVEKEEGEEVAREWGGQFFETSGKARVNVEESFYSCVREIRRRKGRERERGRGRGGRGGRERENCILS